MYPRNTVQCTYIMAILLRTRAGTLVAAQSSVQA
jgi:hypothetical protein